MANTRDELWSYAEAVGIPEVPPDQLELHRRQRYRLWTRQSEAVFIVDENESPLHEARLYGRTLRERSYRNRHQVLHLRADPRWALERVAGPFGQTGADQRQLGPDGLQRIELPTGTVVIRNLRVDLQSVPPTTTRVWKWSWEVYRRLKLPECFPFAGADLPVVLVGFAFHDAFLFTASTSNAATLHVVWRSRDSEVELVIGNHDGVGARSDVQCKRAMGPVRFADLYSDDPQVIASGVDYLGLKGLARVRDGMPSESSPGRWTIGRDRK